MVNKNTSHGRIRQGRWGSEGGGEGKKGRDKHNRPLPLHNPLRTPSDQALAFGLARFTECLSSPVADCGRQPSYLSAAFAGPPAVGCGHHRQHTGVPDSGSAALQLESPPRRGQPGHHAPVHLQATALQPAHTPPRLAWDGGIWN